MKNTFLVHSQGCWNLTDEFTELNLLKTRDMLAGDGYYFILMK